MAQDEVYQLRLSKKARATYAKAAKTRKLTLAAWIKMTLDDATKKKVAISVEAGTNKIVITESKPFPKSKKPFVCRLKGYKD